MNTKLVGTVISGNHLGRTFGFPTANIALDKKSQLAVEEGVFAAMATVARKTYPSIVNIGRSPSVITGGGVRVEVHLIGYEGDIYGRKLSVELVERLRGEVRFASQTELINQLECDRERALAILQPAN